VGRVEVLEGDGLEGWYGWRWLGVFLLMGEISLTGWMDLRATPNPEQRR
jgi:hypothetical protein